MQKSVVFKNHAQDIYAVLHLPAHHKDRKVPAVALCHGFTGNKSEPHRIFVKMARELAAHGIAALRFDFRGTGDSEGDFEDMTISGEISDTIKALDWMEDAAKHEGLDKDRFGLLGFSLGGLVASCTAGRDKRVKALSIWGAVSDLNATLERFTRDRQQSIRNMSHGAIDYAGNIVGKAFLAEFGKIHPVNEVEHFKGPVLIVHGTEDKTEPATNATHYYKVLGGKHPLTHKVLVEGADHSFSSVPWEKEAIHATAEFFKKAL